MAVDYWQEFEEGKIYHFYNRANGQRLLFEDEKDYSRFLEGIKKYLSAYFDFYAYCLIPNHFHFLLKVKDCGLNVRESLKNENTNCSRLLLQNEITINQFLEDQLRRLFSGYALYFNYRHDQRGALFQKRPKRVEIYLMERLLYQVCYIHHNPIHHFLAKDYVSWKYSSYNAFYSDKTSLIDRKEVLKWFGDGDEAFGKKIFIHWHNEFGLG